MKDRDPIDNWKALDKGIDALGGGLPLDDEQAQKLLGLEQMFLTVQQTAQDTARDAATEDRSSRFEERGEEVGEALDVLQAIRDGEELSDDQFESLTFVVRHLAAAMDELVKQSPHLQKRLMIEVPEAVDWDAVEEDLEKMREERGGEDDEVVLEDDEIEF